MPGRAAAPGGCGEARAPLPTPGTWSVSSGPVPRGAHAPGWPRIGPRSSVAALPVGGTSGVRLAFLAPTQVAQVAGAPLSEDSPRPQWCGASHACTPPWKLTSEVAPALVEE